MKKFIVVMVILFCCVACSNPVKEEELIPVEPEIEYIREEGITTPYSVTEVAEMDVINYLEKNLLYSDVSLNNLNNIYQYSEGCMFLVLVNDNQKQFILMLGVEGAEITWHKTIEIEIDQISFMIIKNDIVNVTGVISEQPHLIQYDLNGILLRSVPLDLTFQSGESFINVVKVYENVTYLLYSPDFWTNVTETTHLLVKVDHNQGVEWVRDLTDYGYDNSYRIQQDLTGNEMDNLFLSAVKKGNTSGMVIELNEEGDIISEYDLGTTNISTVKVMKEGIYTHIYFFEYSSSLVKMTFMEEKQVDKIVGEAPVIFVYSVDEELFLVTTDENTTLEGPYSMMNKNLELIQEEGMDAQLEVAGAFARSSQDYLYVGRWEGKTIWTVYRWEKE